ncbi:hypothetical protein J6590_075135 [Homalodisca vitripennis]|nr:hypothetical protein J6590_075135 [Homalodisca vitripennis]
MELRTLELIFPQARTNSSNQSSLDQGQKTFDYDVSDYPSPSTLSSPCRETRGAGLTQGHQSDTGAPIGHTSISLTQGYRSDTGDPFCHRGTALTEGYRKECPMELVRHRNASFEPCEVWVVGRPGDGMSTALGYRTVFTTGHKTKGEGVSDGSVNVSWL